jgi:hypothetical protein
MLNLMFCYLSVLPSDARGKRDLEFGYHLAKEGFMGTQATRQIIDKNLRD